MNKNLDLDYIEGLKYSAAFEEVYLVLSDVEKENYINKLRSLEIKYNSKFFIGVVDGFLGEEGDNS